jgi:hypothetical protein
MKENEIARHWLRTLLIENEMQTANWKSSGREQLGNLILKIILKRWRVVGKFHFKAFLIR